MKVSISGYKDTDREILLAMSDKDLLATCSSNKYFFTSVCDDNFFYRKLLRSYPDTLKDFNLEKDKNYKQYYLKIVYYVAKLLEEFKYSYIAGNPEKQYNIFKRSPNNESLLLEAAKEGEIEIVKEAIKRGADIHANNDEALRWASENGQLEVVKYLVSLGADIHADNDHSINMGK